VRALAKVSFQLALGLWVGAVVFVSFVVAPAVFRAVPNETAGAVMGQIFPLYYGFTVVAGVVALGSALLLLGKTSGAGAWKAIVVMLAVMLAVTTYAAAVVNPRARELRPALHREPVDPGVREEFDRLHRRAVQLNGLVLLLGLVTVAVAATSTRLPGE
jgi:uncharacterized membrane protein